MKTQAICKHQLVSNQISNLVLTAFILATALMVNFFHFPLLIHGIELERFELGLAVILILVGRVAKKNLVVVLVLLPLVDQIQHGHNLITVPLEIIFNLFLLGVFISFTHLINNNQNHIVTKYGIIIACLICVILAKIVFFATTILIFIPTTINFFKASSWTKNNSLNNYVVLSFYLLLVTIKFSIILGIGLYGKKRK